MKALFACETLSDSPRQKSARSAGCLERVTWKGEGVEVCALTQEARPEVEGGRCMVVLVVLL